jgi:putative restriction endonuclease
MSKKDTVILNHKDLKYLLIDSLKQYSEDVTYISGNNPYTFNINKKTIHIFIHNVHESGSGRTNPDECRIQVNKTPNFLAAKSSGKPVLFFGFFADENIFTAWNPFIQTERINTKKTISLYSRFSVQKKAAKQGLAIYKDSDSQVIISFKPEYLGLYIDNFTEMHLSDEQTLLALIKKSNTSEETEKDLGDLIHINRKKFTVTHKRFKRDSAFKERINEVYGGRCAICGIQLELVEAAHIIPHSHEKGTDDIKNGICLCALHHKAFDNGLIYIVQNYTIKINNEKVEYLEKIHRDGGITKFKALQLEEKIKLPSSYIYNPSKEFIKIANQIRGISEK